MAQASSALSREARALTSAVRTTEGSGAFRDGIASRRESPNIRSPEAWTRKRMGEAHATQRRTTGATGARKSDAATTGSHAVLHARARSDREAGGDGQDSAVGTPAVPTASKKAGQ
eukprot:3356561-Pleurochrysis_carterae.AAC.1